MIEAFRILLTELQQTSAALGEARADRDRAEHELNRIKSAPSGDAVALLDHIVTGQKIEAIKQFRDLTGYGLKESKDAVERVMWLIPRSAQPPSERD